MITKIVLFYTLLSIAVSKIIHRDLEDRLSALEKSMKEKDDAIEVLEKSLHSVTNCPYGVFCAYNWEGKRAGDTSIITFDEMTIATTNLDGTGLDLDTGVFSAGQSGTWSVAYSFTSTVWDKGEVNYIDLFKNDENIMTAGAGTRYEANSDYFATTIGRTIYIHLDKGDILYLKPQRVGMMITHISVCYELVTKQ